MMSTKRSNLEMTPSPPVVVPPPPTKKAKIDHPVIVEEKKKSEVTTTLDPSSSSSSQILFDNTDLWVNHILPFVGAGNFAFVGGSCHRLNDLYRDYFSTMEETKTDENRRPKVKYSPSLVTVGNALATDTFYGSVFSSLPCTKYWYNSMKEEKNTQALQGGGFFLCESMIKAGNVQVFQWAHENRICGISCNMTTMDLAAKHGRFDIMKYIHDNGSQWDATTCATLARYGHLEILQQLRLLDCPWNSQTCWRAASSGHLTVLKWARVNGCPWDANTCASAAAAGSLECLQWARVNGCPWDSTTVLFAKKAGNHDIVKWAVANGCPER